MQPVLKKSSLYKKTIFTLSSFTTVFVFGCILFGYFFLPMASAFYAALLVYENNSKRVMSYALPVVMFLINLVLRDFSFYSLEAIAYVAVGLIIYLTCKRDISKGESVFWTTFAITVMLVISAIFLAFETLGSLGMTPLQQFFSNLFLSYKSFFVDLLTSITVLDKEGVSFFAYNPGEAELIFHEIVILLIPIIILFAFLLSGIAFKIFRCIIVRYSGEESGINSWNFMTSNLVAYFYLIVAILAMFVSGSGVFGLSLTSLNTVFSAVFAYIGVSFVYSLIVIRGKSSFFAVTLIIIGCIIFSSFAIQLLSFIGVYFNIVTNKISRGKVS